MIGLELILNLNKIPFKELADKLGITKQNVSMWISEERKIPKKYLPVLEEMFNIPREYLQKELTNEDEIDIQSFKIKNDQKDIFDKRFYDDLMSLKEFNKELDYYRGNNAEVFFEGLIECSYVFRKLGVSINMRDNNTWINFWDDDYDEELPNNRLSVGLDLFIGFETEMDDLVIILNYDVSIRIQKLSGF